MLELKRGIHQKTELYRDQGVISGFTMTVEKLSQGKTTITINSEEKTINCATYVLGDGNNIFSEFKNNYWRVVLKKEGGRTSSTGDSFIVDRHSQGKVRMYKQEDIINKKTNDLIGSRMTVINPSNRQIRRLTRVLNSISQ